MKVLLAGSWYLQPERSCATKHVRRENFVSNFTRLAMQL